MQVHPLFLLKHYPAYTAPVIINHDVWIGANATILGGTIGACSVVAAGALVNKDIPPYSVVAGVPAKILRILEKDADL